MRRAGKGQASVLEVVNVIAGELDPGQLEEARPADTFDPLAQALVFAGVLGVHVYDVADRLHRLGPARRIVGQEGNRQLGELRRAASVADFAADPDGQAIVLGIVQWHGRAHGVAVAAIHTLLFDHLDRVLAIDRFRTNRARGAGGDQRRDLAN